MPEDLRQLLEKSAQLNHRSMNAELVMRLRKSVEEDPVFMPQVSEEGGEYSTDENQLLSDLIAKMPKKKRKALLKFIKSM